MCEALEKMKKKAVERNMLESIQNLMKNLKMTAEQAMDALGMSAEDKKRYVQML
jgi:oligoribonuclease NrnB/cAMP/cGMP phosphodiesterase (DHH superfamily)